MNKKNKAILAICLVLISGIAVYWLISNRVQGIMDGKPNGPYYSSKSIDEAKRENVWVTTFLPTSKKQFSADRTIPYEIKEV